MKFKQTFTLNCLECNYDQTIVKATLWRKILFKLDLPIKVYCEYCDKKTDHVELDEGWRW